MKVLFDNVDFDSQTGPNSFAKKLRNSLLKNGHKSGFTRSGDLEGDVQLSFISSQFLVRPNVLRLDGIYFNTSQDYENLNVPIQNSYDEADGIVFQTEFNKKLIEYYFGEHERSFIINNGVSFEDINNIQPLENHKLDKFENVWCCASSWRPHKRLQANIEYFLEHTDEKSCIVIAGNNPDYAVGNTRVLYAGPVNLTTLVGIYKRSSHFIHLSWLDHCPNVVVDARASGCKIICSDSGGTKEIAGLDATLVQEKDEWDFSPIDLYNPPDLDFTKTKENKLDSNINIDDVCQRYVEVFDSVKAGYEEELYLESIL